MSFRGLVLVCLALSLAIAPAHGAAPIQGGNLLVPNSGLAAIQEVNPTTLSIVQTIPLPPGYNYSSPYQAHAALVRASDHVILTNARNSSGVPTVLTLSDTGVLLAAQSITPSYLQQIVFDPLDPTQNTVLGGAPFSPSVLAVNPVAQTVTTRLSIPGGNLIGLWVDSLNRLLVGDHAVGKVYLYDVYGNSLGLFADVVGASGFSEINAITEDDAGNIYVAQNNRNRILKFNSSGGYLGALTVPSFNRPAYVGFNPNDGLLYAGNVSDDRLVVLTTSGVEVNSLHLGGGFIGIPTVVPGVPPPPQPVLHGCLDQNGAPKAGIPVVLQQPGEGKTTTLTDANGCWSFNSVVSGKPFRIRIQGYIQ